MKKVLWLVLVAVALLAAACGGGSGVDVPPDDNDGSTDTPDAPRTPDAQLALYGTFHAMGVIVSLPTDADPLNSATASVQYRPAGQSAYQQGFPLTRVTGTRFVGSLFDLTPGTTYDVTVRFAGADAPALDGTQLQATAATREEIVLPEADQILFAAPSGSGSTCSEIVPCALATAVAAADAGTTILLRGGVYDTGAMTVPRGGTQQAPVIIAGYPGEAAVLDGSDPAVFAWTHYGSGVYQTTINVTDPHVVMVGDQRLFPYDTLSGLAALAYDSTPGFFADGQTLYVRLADGSAPAADQVRVSRFGSAFTVTRDFIYFRDLTFRYYGQGAYPKVIYLDGASNCLVQGCVFANNDLGVGLKREAHRNVIENCVFYDAIFDWPWQPIKDLGGIEDGGVRFYSPVDGRGNIIRGNVFHDDFDAFGACPADSSAVTNETDVYDNLVYRMGDDGMETDGRCSNVRIWDNTFHDVLIGISLAPVYDGPVYCLRNLIHRTGVGNNGYTGSPFKFNSGYGLSGRIYLFHNTADAYYADNNGLHIKSPGTWQLIYARNNIWSGTADAINNYNLSQPVDLDYDDLWNGDQSRLVRWDDSFATVEAFAAQTGQEANGFNEPPGFSDPDSQDYTLASDSPLIDQGVLIPGINHHYNGLGPDIGAFEQ